MTVAGRGVSVVKVGGSLLEWPGLPGRLRGLLDEIRSGPDGGGILPEGLPKTGPILVVGGGRFADSVRDLDRIQGLGEDASHALALRALTLSAFALAALVPGLTVVHEPPHPDAPGPVPVLDPGPFLDRFDRPGDSPLGPLPRSWDVTSDSISARVAERLGSRALILLKSADLPPGTGLSEAARIGLIDAYFPVAAGGLPGVLYVNLRAPRPRAEPLVG